jgi:hypothetical protein
VTKLPVGTDVLVDFDGGTFVGEIVKAEHGGYVLAKIHVDPLHDFGRASARIDPEQVVAVRSGHVKAA